MNAYEIAQRLGARQTATNPPKWRARCPAHDDNDPSLVINVDQNGRVHLNCFAQCAFGDILAALNLKPEDLAPSNDVTPPRPPRPGAAKAAPAWECGLASEHPEVRAWLEARAISEQEIAALECTTLAKNGPGPPQLGACVVFTYYDERGGLLYRKARNVGNGKKTFVRDRVGAAAQLYGVRELAASAATRVIVVEGEMDVHALRSAGFTEVVSLPDGANSKLSPALLSPLARFKEILLATDADAPGEKASASLMAKLGVQRCRRVLFGECGVTHKDANDALMAGWRHDDFEAAFARALGPALPTPEQEGPVNLAPDQCRYKAINGRFVRESIDKEGNFIYEPLCNFTARIAKQHQVEDGGVEQISYEIEGSLQDGTPLRPLAVVAEDFNSLRWLARWGHGPIISSDGRRTADHIREAIEQTSKPTRAIVFPTVGWRTVGGHAVYMHAAGAIGDPLNASLDLPRDFQRFALPPHPEDVQGAVRTSLRLLDCAQSEVTYPLLAAACLGPLASLLTADFALFMVGTTGSYKTALATLAQRFAGEFDDGHLAANWTGTATAVEMAMYVAKDAVLLIDDFAPEADSTQARDVVRVFERSLRNVGNGGSRARATADLSLRPQRTPGAMIIVTAEDMPPTKSIAARTVVVEVHKNKVKLDALTFMQDNGHRLRHATAGFVAWLQPQYATIKATLPEAVASYRALFRGTKHARQPTALAKLYAALDVYFQFAVDIGAMAQTNATAHLSLALQTFKSIGANQAEHLDSMGAEEHFLDCLRMSLLQGKAYLDRRDESKPPRLGSTLIGCFDGEFAYVLPQAARALVSEMARQQVTMSQRALGFAFVERQYVVPAPDGRPQVQHRFKGGPQRFWRFRLSTLGMADVATPPGLNARSGDGPSGYGSGNGDAPLNPLSSLEPYPQYPQYPKEQTVDETPPTDADGI